MPDVAILHAADKESAATRLADAVAAAGFGVAAVEIGDPAGLADAVDGCAVDARILIWSRPLVSHALHSGDLPRIRQLRGLIEVSADGIAPPSRGDDARVVSISGWRGQPFHPGWQRIHLELKRLCGPGRAPPEARAPAAMARNPPPERTAPAASGGVRPQARSLMLGGGAAVLLVAAVAGAASWLGEGAAETEPRRELPKASGPAGAGEPVRPDPAAGPAPPSAAPVPAPGPRLSEPLPPAETKREAPRPEPALRPARSKPVARPERESSPAAAPAKKYSRKNSKVMREFCERSGRSTPQCRIFLRSVGGREADR